MLLPIISLVAGSLLLFFILFDNRKSNTKNTIAQEECFLGVVRDTNWYEDKSLLQLPYLFHSTWILAFRIEPEDEYGNIISGNLVPVEFKLQQRRDAVANNGDRVTVRGKMGSDGIVSGRQLINQNTGVILKSGGGREKTKYYITALIVLLGVVVGAISNVLFDSFGFPSDKYRWIESFGYKNWLVTALLVGGQYGGMLGLLIAAFFIIIMLIIDSFRQ